MKTRLTLLCIASLAIPTFAETIATTPSPTEAPVADTSTASTDDPFDSYSSTTSTELNYSDISTESTDLVTESEPVVSEEPSTTAPLYTDKVPSIFGKSISAGVTVENRFGYNNHQSGEDNNSDGNFVTNSEEQVIYEILDIRVLPWVTFSYNKHISFHYQGSTPRLEWGNKGAKKGTSDIRFNNEARESTLRNKRYYTDIAFSHTDVGIFNRQLFRIGGQEFKDPHSIIFKRDIVGVSYNGLFVDKMLEFNAGYFILEHKNELLMIDSENKYQSTDDTDGDVLYTADISAHLMDSSITAGLLVIGRDQEEAQTTGDSRTIFTLQRWISPHVSAKIKLPIGSLSLDAQFVYFFDKEYTTLYTFEPSDQALSDNAKKTINSGTALSAVVEYQLSKFTFGTAYLYTSGDQETKYSGEGSYTEDEYVYSKYQTTEKSYYSAKWDSYYNKNKLQFLTEGGFIDNSAWNLIDGSEQNGVALDRDTRQDADEIGGVSVASVWAFYQVNENIKLGAVFGMAQLNAGRKVVVIDGEYQLYVDKDGEKYWYDSNKDDNSKNGEIFEFDKQGEDPLTDSEIIQGNGAPVGPKDENRQDRNGNDEAHDEQIIGSEWSYGVEEATEAISDLGMEFNVQAEIRLFDALTLNPYFAMLMPGDVIIEKSKRTDEYHKSNLIKTGMTAIFEF
ncbi:MAG: hypothetical protein OCD01_09710 [Fibrobacterales bacterium]